MAVEYVLEDYSPEAVVNVNESFLSSTGGWWEDASYGFPGQPMNVCLKGLTSGAATDAVATPILHPLPGPCSGPVTILCATTGATIRYTTDESLPTEESPIYTQALILSQTTTVRAKAFKPGLAPSRVAANTYTVGSGGAVCDALDDCDLSFECYGDGVWAPQQITTHDGTDAAQSPYMDAGQCCYIETKVTGPGLLKFWWRTASPQGRDYIRYFIDYQNQKTIFGDSGWREVTDGIWDGTHTLTWVYRKDPSDTSPGNCGWLDQVRYERSGSLSIADSILPEDDLALSFAPRVQGLSETQHVVITNTDLVNPLKLTDIYLMNLYASNFWYSTDGWVPCHPEHWSRQVDSSGFYVAQNPSEAETLSSRTPGARCRWP
jgi:hypothetical protein